jgi:hypothetical protein
MTGARRCSGSGCRKPIADALGVSHTIVNKDVRGSKFPSKGRKAKGNGKQDGNKLPPGASDGRRDAGIRANRETREKRRADRRKIAWRAKAVGMACESNSRARVCAI